MEKKIFLQTRKNTKLILRNALANAAIGNAIATKIAKTSSGIWAVLLDEIEFPKPAASKEAGAALSASLVSMIDVCVQISAMKKENPKDYNSLSKYFAKEFLAQYADTVAFRVTAEYSINQVQSGKWQPSGTDCWNALAQLASANDSLRSALADLAICVYNNPIVIFGGSSPAAQRCSWEQTAVTAANVSVQTAQQQVNNMCGGWLKSYL